MAADMSTSRPSSESAVILRAVTAIIGTVVALTFLFGFGNVLNLALRLGVPVLVAPAVDLSVIGLLLGTRHLALAGASPAVLRPARRLLIFASVVTLALNVADPLVAGEYGKALFDAVGPLLLIGWAEVGSSFLQAIGQSGASYAAIAVAAVEQPEAGGHVNVGVENGEVDGNEVNFVSCPSGRQSTQDELLEQARREDVEHRVACQRPISADTLRVRLGVGATRARRLVKIVRAEYQVSLDRHPGNMPEGPGVDRVAA